jgi:GT2 family glycosyltransferase
MHRLDRCLSSITRNAYPRDSIELIVVDNGSTDESARVARSHGAIVLSLPGGTVAAARNRGAKAALGSIIAFADSDHEIDRYWIETAVAVLADPAIAATGSAYLTQPSPNWVQQHYDGLRSRPPRRQEVAWLGSGNFAVRRSAFEAVNGFNPNLTTCEDVDLCNRLTLAGFRIVADPDLRSVHFGDPQTLRALFFGELWRGRDNLRVTFSGPRSFGHLRSAVVPIADLLCLVAAATSLMAGHAGLALLLLLAALIPTALRAGVMVRRQLNRGVVVVMQALAVAVVFDLARALALVARGSHGARRAVS